MHGRGAIQERLESSPVTVVCEREEADEQSVVLLELRQAEVLAQALVQLRGEAATMITRADHPL